LVVPPQPLLQPLLVPVMVVVVLLQKGRRQRQ
jgi:hypothetical protein